MMPSNNPSVIDYKEREALRIFRKRVADVLVDLNEYQSHDLWLLRWLRARELNINKSEEMLRKSLSWRAKQDFESCANFKNVKIPDAVNQQFLMQAAGFDNDRCFVGCVQYGKWDIRKLISLGYKSDFTRCVDLMFEQVMKFSEIRSTKESMITQFVVVVDMEGFSLSQITSRETVECILDTVRSFEANHPETLKEAWIVNAPKIFEMLFNLLKPLLTARTLSKVHVCGSNSDKWRPLLLENIHPDQLPSAYGGTNTSCKNYKVGSGFDVFPVYEVFPDYELIPVTIEAGARHVVRFALCKDGKLSWNFRTADYDIGFSLRYSNTNGVAESVEHMEVIYSCSRADSHLHLQKGEHVSEKPGTYFLVFDNSFSRFRQKKLFYCARVS